MKKGKLNFAWAVCMAVTATCLLSPDIKKISPLHESWWKDFAAITVSANTTENVELKEGVDDDVGGTCGTDVSWKLSDGVLTISGTGSMTNWSSSSAVPWDDYKSSITSAVIESGVTTIGNNAFYNCSSLVSVSLPDSLTAVGSNAFRSCSNLASVKLPDGLTSIGSYAFRECKLIKEVRIPAGVTSISSSNPFYECTGLKKVTFASGMTKVPAYVCQNMTALTTVVYEDASKITSIGNNAFYNCSSLTEAPIPDTVTEIGNNAFQSCSSLTSVSLPDSLTRIGSYAFRECSLFKEVRIPAGITSVSSSNPFYQCADLKKVTFASGMTKVPAYICQNMTALTTVEYEDASKITGIGNNAFYNCSSLTEAPIPETVTEIGNNTFQNCSSLESVILPDGLTNIGSSVFYNCSNLASVILPDGLTSIGSYAFRGCKLLEEVRIPAGVTSVSSSNPFYECTALEQVTFARGMTKVPAYMCQNMTALTTVEYEDASKITSIGNYAFSKCSSLTEALIPDTVTEIGNNTFQNCSSLKSVILPDGLDSMGSYVFYNCSSLTAVSVPDTVTEIENNTFQNCSSLASVILSDGLINIGNYAFYNCSSLVSMNLPESVTSIGDYAFNQCTAIRSINIPSKVKTVNRYIFEDCTSLEMVDISGEITDIESYAFSGCSSLREIALSDSLVSIGNNAFYNCSSLGEVELPAGLTTLGSKVFENCTDLTAVNLEDTAITEIGAQCFKNCSSLRKIDIPGSVDAIGNQAFYGCSSARSLTIAQGVKELDGGCFADCIALTEVAIPRSVSTAGTYSSQGPFTGCTKLTKITFAEKMRSVPGYLFYGCDQLTEIVLPDTISEIGEYAFYNCVNLKEINFPLLLYSIGDSAFYNCRQITAADLSHSLESIGKSAFSGCSALAEVSFNEYIKEIPNSCFNGTALTKVILPYAVSSIGNHAFSNIDTLQEISIPAGTVSINSSALNQDKDKLIIKGAAGSEAEKYAQDNGYTFVTGTSFTKAVLDKKEMTLALKEEGNLILDIAPFNAVDAISWSSGNEDVATVEANKENPAEAVVTGVSSGETTITVTAGAIKNVCKVTVGNYATGISLSKSYIYMDSLGDTQTVTASVVPSDADNAALVWSSSDTSVAVVDNKGNVTSKGNGTTRLTVATADNSVKAYCFVTVETEIPAVSLSLNEKSLYLTGGSRTLTAVVTPADATNADLVWSSSDEGVAAVDQNGVVTAVADGTATITVQTVDRKVRAVCEVTVDFAEVPVTGIEISEEEVELAWADKTCQLTAEVYPADADVQTIIWDSSDKEVAVVSQDGKVTATSGGTTVITAKTTDGGYVASCTVTVIRLIDALTLNHGTLSLKVGQGADLKVTIVPQKVTNDQVLWTSSNTNIVTVDDTGHVTAIAEGEAYIRCRARDASMAVASCKVIVEERTVDQGAADPGESGNTNPEETVSGNSESGNVNHTAAGSGGENINENSGMTGGNHTSSVNMKKPGKAKIKKIVPANKKLKVSWKKLAGVTGYQIQYSLNKKFKASKTVTIKKAKTISKTLKKLKKKKKYFVRVRGYVTGKVNGKSVVLYGKWSAVKKQTTK